MVGDQFEGFLLDQVQLAVLQGAFHDLSRRCSLHDEFPGSWGEPEELEYAHSALEARPATFTAARTLDQLDAWSGLEAGR